MHNFLKELTDEIEAFDPMKAPEPELKVNPEEHVPVGDFSDELKKI
jgi:hypothetical protein